MAKQTAAELLGLADHHFKSHWVVASLWQTIADHFYPERADFTVTRNVGQELADGLVDSYPILVRRDLGNSFSAMLRDGEWFEIATDSDPDHDGKAWLEWGSKRMLKLMNDRGANFVRATKEGDHDYAAFGQTALTVEMNRLRSGLLYRCWHLRDVCWWDGVDGQVEGVVRKWKPTYRQMIDYFGDKCHDDIRNNVYRMPFKECDVRHIFLPVAMYGEDRYLERYKYVSIFVDVAHQCVIEETPTNHFMYIVPRFQTIAGSPYAYSPATVVGLPDARSLQAMTHTLLEAAERYARPPIIATSKVVRGDVDLSPDGITWVDHEYDERMGAALRTLQQDRGGYPIGREVRQGIVSVLHSAFYQDKLSMPDKTNMTAYEVSEWMKQYRRQNLPLFAPLESEYNGRICESSFKLLMDNGLMGSPYDIPDSLRGRSVQFKFQSPLTASEEQKKVTQFKQVSELLAEAVQFDQGVVGNLDFNEAFRDAVEGTGSPVKWLRSMEIVLQNSDQMQQQQQVAQNLQTANNAAQVATNVKAAVA